MKVIAYIIFIAIWLGSPQASAQQKISTDSLFTQLEAAADTQKIALINQLFSRLVYQNTDTARALARQALEVSKRLDLQANAADAWYKIGMSYAIQGKYPEGVDAFLKTHEIYTALDRQTGIAFAEKGLGNMHQVMGEMEPAIDYFRISLKRYRAHGDSNQLNAALNNLALGFLEIEAFDSAAHYLQERADLSEAMRNLTGLASAQNNLGTALKGLGRYEDAEDSYLSALQIRREQGAQRHEGLVLGNLADLYRMQGKFAESAITFEESINIRERIGDRRGVALNSRRLGETLIEVGDLRGAARATEKSVSIAQELGFLDYEISAMAQLKGIYSRLGQFQKAFDASEQLAVLNDSLLNVEKAKLITEMETKYDVQLKEQQLAQQESEIALLEAKNLAQKRLRWLLIAASTLLLALLGVLYNRYQIKQRSEAELAEKNRTISEINLEIQQMNKELERKMLRAQMDPHFIFNSLNSIQHFIATNEKELAIRYLSKFAKLIRRILDNSIQDRVALNDELSLLEDYMELEELRMNHSFSHEIQIGEEVDVYNTEVPFLIIQPYVENAIKHGLKNLKDPGKLIIKLEDGGEHLNCFIEDNGIGREAAAKYKRPGAHKSHGMSVTEQRLQLLNKANEKKTRVEIVDLKNSSGEALGTKVALSIPYELN